MYERFTDRARKVLQLANQEAQRCNRDYIGPEHVLAAIVKEGSGVACNALKNLGINLQEVRKEIERCVMPGKDMVTMGKLPLTPRTKQIIEYSIDISREWNNNHVGTEHLLMGVLKEGNNIGVQILLNLGITSEKVEAEVHNLLGYKKGKEPPSQSYFSTKERITPVFPEKTKKVETKITPAEVTIDPNWFIHITSTITNLCSISLLLATGKIKETEEGVLFDKNVWDQIKAILKKGN